MEDINIGLLINDYKGELVKLLESKKFQRLKNEEYSTAKMDMEIVDLRKKIFPPKWHDAMLNMGMLDNITNRILLLRLISKNK